MNEIKLEHFAPSKGESDEEVIFGKDERAKQHAIAEDKAIREHMSPKGALNLPPLLDARRLEWGITDGAFRRQAAFERILVKQIKLAEDIGETYGGGLIFKPETVQAVERMESCRGIIVSAGLKALDDLRSNGMDVGHIVQFIALAPYSIQHDVINGVRHYLLNMNCGDIIDSEDLGLALRKGEMSLQFVEGESDDYHTFWPTNRVHELHLSRKPSTPWVEDDR